MTSSHRGGPLPLPENPKREVRGRDSISGLPRVVEVTSHEITEALKNPLSDMIQAIERVLEKVPPELAGDVVDRGMVLSGGTALLNGLDSLIAQSTGVPVHIADDPMLCVVKGCAKAIEHLEVFRKNLTTR